MAKTFVKLPISAEDIAKAPHSELIDLTAAAKLIPGRRPGTKINLNVLRRYSDPNEGRSCGTPGYEGRVYVVLPTIYRSYKRYTTVAAVQMFLEHCARIENQPRPKPPARTDRQA